MDFSLLGICFDKTQTLRKGSSKGPNELRKYFNKMETFIDGIDLADHFLKDLGNINPKDLNNVQNKVDKMLDGKSFPVILGGEHSITLSCVKRMKPDKVIVFDAHPDLEDKDDHTGVMRKVGREIGYKNLYLYGMRIFSKKEHEFIRKNKIKVVDLNGLRKLKGRIYLSVDFDVFDPSLFSSVGNPEPNGITFKEFSEAVRIISRNLIAVDFVEFT